MMAPKRKDHSLHLPVLISAIFKISPYLGKVYSYPHLLHLWISIVRNFHDIPVITCTCIATLSRPSAMHFVQSGSFGVQLIKSILNHPNKDLILSSSPNCNICSGIKDLILSRTSGLWYCSLIPLYNKKTFFIVSFQLRSRVIGMLTISC